MCTRAMQARRTCLLMIDAERDKEGKGGWEERHTALLVVTALLRKKQDGITEAVVYFEEALQTWRDVIPDARDDPDSFHLFATLAGCMPQSGATVTPRGTSTRCTG